MPELPEVETLSREIHDHFVGLDELARTVTEVKTFRKDLRFPFPMKALKALKGRRLDKVGRRAKYLTFTFDGLGDESPWILLSHLGMTGSWRTQSDNHAEPHDHLMIRFMDGRRLVYNDPRRFGYVDVIAAQEMDACQWFKHLGPEPLAVHLTADRLHLQAVSSRQPIKTWIMDQRHLVGVGNIYASEALHLAKVHPLRRAGSLHLAEWQRLLDCIRSVLRAAIDSGGTTLRDYRKLTGDQGAFQSHLQVYGREGQSCGFCGDSIRQVFLGGRSTFWCEK